jgi:tetratricopeptide (TPR) repeat protein
VDDALAPFALVIRPHVTQVDNIWRVHLDAKTRDGHTWQAESSSSDVLDATRAASNILLAQLGFGGGPGRHSGSNVQQEYLLRIEAAQIAGQPDLASELIDKAPPELQHTPALMFAQAELYCQQGKLDPCAQTLHDLLKQLPANEQPVLRAKALTALWFTSKRENHFAEGEAALTEAINILRAQHDAEALATAYLDRSHLYFYQGKVDEATADLGSARVNYALAGDTVGQAKVDYGMGMIAMRRRQFGAALPLMQHAYEQFQRMGVRQLVAVALSGVANAQKMMLQFPDELATTDRYWPLDQKHLDFLDPYTRHQLGLIRAGALADNGRTVDAGTLFERILAESNVENEADLRAMASTSLAQLALERGDTQGALAWINKAMAGTGLQQDDDPLDYADAWLIKVAVLQRTGDIGELKHTVDAMQTWAAHLPMRNDGVDIRIMQAQAAQAWSEGKHDEALERLKSAMAAANTLGVPELIVGVAKPYALALLASGHLDQAIAVSGQLSTWANQDWRAAWVEACVYRALGQTAAWEKARSKAQQLAGDRPLPVAGVVEFF